MNTQLPIYFLYWAKADPNYPDMPIDVRFQLKALDALSLAWADMKRDDVDENCAKRFDHGRTGYAWAMRELSEWSNANSTEILDAWRRWLAAVTGHHGDLSSGADVGGEYAEACVMNHDRSEKEIVFLSRVEVPWEVARNPYDFHRQLWRLFPGEANEKRKTNEDPRHGFLFRVEDHQPGKGARFLVQSHRKPEAATGLVLVGTREFHRQPAAGQPLFFVSEKCRVPLIKEDEQIAWLARKLAGAATVEAATVLRHPPLYLNESSFPEALDSRS